LPPTASGYKIAEEAKALFDLPPPPIDEPESASNPVPAGSREGTLPYIPSDTLALSFGGSRSLSEITTDQVRRFADTARLPASPLWPIVMGIAERTVAAWDDLAEKDLLPEDMGAAIGRQILAVAAMIRVNGTRRR
jgi:hypothetical protein